MGRRIHRAEQIIGTLARGAVWMLPFWRNRKVAKVWMTYRVGGLRLLWSRLYEKLGPEQVAYEPAKRSMGADKSRLVLRSCPRQPLISIVIPVYKVRAKWLDMCLKSVVQQYYRNWEVVLVDDASCTSELDDLMADWASRDDRIKVHRLEHNCGIAMASNEGIARASGEFVGFLDHDDELSLDALVWVVWAVNSYPGVKWLYSDEDMIDVAGRCYDPHYKPDFSMEFLLSNMFICHFSVYAREALAMVSGFRAGFEGSQDHDLALRLSERISPDQIVHIPRVLYHWRAIPGSTATGVHTKTKPHAPVAGRKAVQEALARRGVCGRVTSHALCPTVYQIEFEPRRFPKVSIIIPTRNAAKSVRTCIDAIRKNTCYPDYEIVVVDNGSDEKELHGYLHNEAAHGRVKLLSYEKPFNHSAMNNMAVAAVDSEFVVLMNNDVVVKSAGWIEQMVGVTELDEKIAAVGCMLIYPLGLIQHAGVLLGLCGVAGHAHKNTVPESLGYLGRLQTLQEFSAVTAAMVLLRKKCFLEVGGFDAVRYPALYNDVDLCIRLRMKGYRCIYTPMVRAVHHESLTRPISGDDLASGHRLVEDYGPLLKRDPFYNPNLSLTNERFFGFREFPPEHLVPKLSENEVIAFG